MAKAHRVFQGIAFCPSCYKREFKPRPCRNCGASTRLHRTQETGLCRVCDSAERRCLRCERPVPRAALRIENKVVCPSCRRYFPPFPIRRSAPDHETCSVCRKHRDVARRDDDGRPLCSRCADHDRREEVRELDESYWRQGVLNRHALLEPTLSTAWAQELLSGFIEFQLGRVPAKRLALTLSGQVDRLKLLEQRFDGLDAITEESLLARYTSEELRRSQTILAYLRSIHIETPNRDQSEQLAEGRRIAALLEKAQRTPHSSVVQRFHVALGQPNKRGVTPEKRSQRLNLTAATGWVTLAGDDSLSQKNLDRYLRERPGQRAALSSFIGYLRREEGINLDLPSKPHAKFPIASQRTGDVALARCLSILGSYSNSFETRRAALAGALVGLLGLPLRVVVRIPRRGLVESRQGGLKLSIPDVNIKDVLVDEKLSANIERYLGDRDERVGSSDGFLLPGRPFDQHVGENTVSSLLKTLGVQVRMLSIRGHDWIRREGAKGGLLDEEAPVSQSG